MIVDQYIINRKVNIMDLGQMPGNISDAGRKLGASRQLYHDIREAIRGSGIEGLLEKTRKMLRMSNRVAPGTGQKIPD